MNARLTELMEALPWVETVPNSFRFEVKVPNGIVHWWVIVESYRWRVICDEGEQIFPDEATACGYFWDRLRSPPPNYDKPSGKVLSATATEKGRQSRRTIFVLVPGSIVAFAPVVAVLICGALARLFGCQVDEGGPHQCMAFGHDIGDLLYTLGVSGWLMIFLALVMLAVTLGWIAFAIDAIIRIIRKSVV